MLFVKLSSNLDPIHLGSSQQRRMENLSSTYLLILVFMSFGYELFRLQNLVISFDGCNGENKNKTIRAFLRVLLLHSCLPKLKKRSVVWMKIGHTKLSSDKYSDSYVQGSSLNHNTFSDDIITLDFNPDLKYGVRK